MKYLIYLIIIIALVGVNIGLFDNFQLQGQIPNLPLLLVIYFCLEKKDYDFYFIAFFSGIFLDFYSTGFFGGFTASFLALAMALYFLFNYFLVFELNWKTLSLLLLGSLLFVDLFFWLYGLAMFKLGLAGSGIGLKILISHFAAEFFYNWLLLYPMYLLFNFIKKSTDNLTIKRRGFVK